MSQRRIGLRSSVFAAVLVLLFGIGVQADNGTWDGGASVYWTNNVNWNNDWAAYPSGDQTATFNGTANNRTNINIAGLSSIQYVTFDGPSIGTYSIGLAPVNSQKLVLRNGGNIRMTGTVKNGNHQSVDTAVQLGPDRGGSSYTIQNDHTFNVLTLNGNIAGPASGGTAGDKTLNLNGSGQIRLLGNIDKGGANILDLTVNNSGMVTLAGTNVFRLMRLYGGAGSVMDIGAGQTTLTNGGGDNIVSTYGGLIKGSGVIVLSTAGGESYSDNRVEDLNSTLTLACRLTGAGGFEFYSGSGYGGTIVLSGLNDFAGHILMNSAGKLSVAKIGNRGSTDSNLGAGTYFAYNNWTFGGPTLIYTGTGESTDRILRFNSPGKVEQAGSGNLNFTAGPSVLAGGVTFTLLGSTEGTGEISGPIANGSGSLHLEKAGTGLWTLSGSNTYSGTTSVKVGSLVLSGANGSVLNSSGITIGAAGTFVLNNTFLSNHSNRVKDNGTVTMNGGTLRFQHNGGAADYSESVGTVSLSSGANTVIASQAASNQTSTLTITSLTRGSGTVNFVGVGLGTDARNRILIGGLSNGLIGPWATVNGTHLAAYDSTRGVCAAEETVYTDIAARGPSSVIANNASSNVRINSDGVSGDITLAAATNTINTLLQNTATPATVATAGRTFRVSGVIIPSGKAAVTLGDTAGDGTLSSATSGGTLALANDSASELRVNAVIADNTAASALSQSGSGKVILAAANTFSGETVVSGGSLVLAHEAALQNSTLTVGSAAPVFDGAVAGQAFTLGGLTGTGDLPLNDGAGNALALSVGKNNGSSTYSGILSGSGALTKIGTGTLTLSGTNTFSGGLTVSAGKVVAGQLSALGSGPVVNNGTIDLSIAPGAYTGLSTSMTGNGTVNVSVMPGTWFGGYVTYLNGDYSGFTGTWNLGGNASGVGSSKIVMNGRDNAAAAIIVRTNSTLQCTAATRHEAGVTLQGGSMGESSGQLRLENNAEWAGPVFLAAPVTNSAHGFFGSASGTGYVSGQIADGGTGLEVAKVGGSTITITGTNNLYGGRTWIKNGTLRAVALGNVGETGSLGTPATAAAAAIKIGNGGTGATLGYLGEEAASDRAIDLAGTTGGATLDLAGTNAWLLTGGMTVSGTGAKTLTLSGWTAGIGEFSGVISNGVGSTIALMKAGSGTWKLSNANTYSGGTQIKDGGTLVAAHPKALGTGTVTFPNAPGTLDLANDGADETPYEFYMPSGTAATLKSNRSAPGEGINHNLGVSHVSGSTVYVTNGANVVSGTPTITMAYLDLYAGSAATSVMCPTTADLIISGGASILSSAFPKTLRLDGTSLGSAILGPISNGTGSVVSLYKTNIGTWTLNGSNTYSGTTSVDKGLLAVTGPQGALLGTSGITLAANGVLEIRNSAATNLPNRLNDAAGLTLNGGALRFVHTGGAANYSETAGALSVGPQQGTIETSQAAADQTSTLTFASLARTGSATVNFTGAGLGMDARNTIRFSTPPTLSNGIIGPWAMYNGTGLASYDDTLGVIPVPDSAYTNIAAWGPSVIPDNATFNARINEQGTEGDIALEGATSSSVNTLLQNTPWESRVAMTNKTFLTAGVMIGNGNTNLTLGTAENEGVLMPLTAGGSLALVNHSAEGLLTVNAVVTNNATASILSKSGAGKVRLNGAVTHTGGTFLGEGELVLAGSGTQTIAHVISGAGALAKDGDGRITLSGANTYEGLTSIRKGTLLVNNNAALGSKVAGTVITDGGTLDLGATSVSENGLKLGSEPIIVSGKGVDERGAIINSSNLSQYNALHYVTLAGDTTFGGDQSKARWDLRNEGGLSAMLTLNGFTLSKVGFNMVGLTGVTVVPGAGKIDIQQGSFTVEAGTVMGGSFTNTLTVQSGAVFDIYEMTVPIWWTLVMNDNGRYYARQGNAARNFWAGPVTLNGNAVFDGISGAYSTLSGDISGSGSLLKVGAGTIYLTGSNNTYAGTTSITNGILWASHPGSIPGWDQSGNVHLSKSGTLAVAAGDGTTGWNVDQINALIRTVTVSNDSASVLLDTTWAPVSGITNFQKAVGLTVQGTNAVTLSGVNTNSTGVTANGYVRLYSGGSLNLDSGSSNVFGRVVVQPGSLGGTLNIDGETKLENLYVGNANGDRARVVISTNVTMTSHIYVGNNAVANGAVIQNSGTVNIAPASSGTDVLSLGNAGGYGYYRMNGGALNVGQFAVTGTGGGVPNGVFDLYGGNVSVTANGAWLLWGWTGGNGVVNLFNGTFSAPPGGMEVTMGFELNRNCFGMLNLLGPNAFLNAATGTTTSRSIDMARNAGNLASVINLNAGVILANRVRAGAAATPSYFNFNGGTLRANAGTTVGSTFMQGLTAATVYPGGAVIDSTNALVTVNQSLVAPDGLGVGGITVFNPGSGYIGAPLVMISGGSGRGATAVATVDLNPASSAAGQVTGITVTSPGVGYQPGDTLIVSLFGGGYLTPAQAGALLTPNSAAGGLVKLGSGTLTLGGTNTYGGATTISEGTLRLAHVGALPTNAVINVAGGTYDLNGLKVTNGEVRVTDGLIRQGELASAGFTKLGSGTLTLAAPLASSGPIVIEGGVVELRSQPGLYEGFYTNNTSMNTTSNNPCSRIEYSTRLANTTSWPAPTTNITCIYTGCLWNRAPTNETWTFAENFDDAVKLVIDGNTLIDGGTAWNVPTKANYTLAPGAHTFEARFYQGIGGAGPVTSQWWTASTLGFGVDYLGRNENNIANYVALTDPGDGSLLTLTNAVENLLSAGASVTVAADAVLNLGGNSQNFAELSGSGLVTNGVVSVTGVIEPGGTDALGVLTVAAPVTLSGMLLADVAYNGDSDLLSVQGNADISGLALVIANPERLNRAKKYTLMRCAGTLTGTFASVTVPDSRWSVTYGADGTVHLVFANGTLFWLK